MSLPNPHEANRRILVVDDNEAIHHDLRKVLGGGSAGEEALRADEALIFGEDLPAPTRFEVESAFQGREALQMVTAAVAAHRPYAMAFVDIRMPPGWDGVETITHLWEVCPELQVVICTAYSDYSWDSMIERLGHSENLIILKKPFDNIEVLQLAHALTRKWQVTHQAQMRMEDLDRLVAERTAALQCANEQLRLSEERFGKAFAASPIPLAIQDAATGRFVDANERFLDITGHPREELTGRTPADVALWPDGDTASLSEGASVHDHPCTFQTRSGEIREALVSTETLQLGLGSHRLLILQDISGRVRMEHRLRQAQKMEAVGQLAAGIAHHFNNLHAAIQGNLFLCQQDVREPSVLQLLHEANTASVRAVGLTRELLSFGRRQLLRPCPVDLNQLLLRTRPRWIGVLGPAIELGLQLAPDLPKAQADVDSLEWMLNHLCANARDAMPAGGRWTLRTELIRWPQSGSPAAMSGPAVCLSATDSGVGMPPEVVARLFEPFFTTKAVGQGNGLGLASVYGLVKQQEGHMDVSSQPGQGSTFRIYLPVAECTAGF